MAKIRKKDTKKYGEVVWKGRRRRLGMPLSFTRYILAVNKLYTSVGFFSIKEEQADLYKVVDFSLKLSFGQRIFGCGTIVIHVKDKTCPEITLLSVKKPREVIKLLEDNVEKERVRYKIHGRDMIGASGIGPFSDDLQ
ncbi:MAG: PH domain-containing protein [Oscillospiraceae bacterium]|nr:PH domain-containing protein [Oscillospiraceae bacterium]